MKLFIPKVLISEPIPVCPACESSRQTPEGFRDDGDIEHKIPKRLILFLICRDCGVRHEHASTDVELCAWLSTNIIPYHHGRISIQSYWIPAVSRSCIPVHLIDELKLVEEGKASSLPKAGRNSARLVRITSTSTVVSCGAIDPVHHVADISERHRLRSSLADGVITVRDIPILGINLTTWLNVLIYTLISHSAAGRHSISIVDEEEFPAIPAVREYNKASANQP